MMMVMVDSLNCSYFGGKRQITCYTCHRNSETPKVTPALAEQYATPLPEDPDATSRNKLLDRILRIGCSKNICKSSSARKN